MTGSPSAIDVLNREFLAMRSRLLELAAALDRVDRAPGSAAGDPRLRQLLKGMAVVAEGDGDRAERLQVLLSLPYDPQWFHARQRAPAACGTEDVAQTGAPAATGCGPRAGLPRG